MTNFDLMRLIIRDERRKITPTQQLILLHLIDRGDQNNICWPSQDLIAIQTGYSTRCIGKAIKDLQEAGYLEVLANGKGRNHSSKYRITLPKNPNEFHLLAEENQNEVHLLTEENPNEVHLLAEEHPNEVHLLTTENPNVVPLKPERRSVKPERGSYKGIQEEIQEEIKDIVGKPDYAEISVNVIDYLNSKTGKKFKTGKAHKKHITARLKEGHTFNDLISVIDKKTTEWLTDPHMNEYLRPSTLFNSEKFEGYLNAIPKPVFRTVADQRAGVSASLMDANNLDWIGTDHKTRQAKRASISAAVMNVGDTDW